MELRAVLGVYADGLYEALTSGDKNTLISAAHSALGLQRFIVAYIESDGNTDVACARLMFEASLLRGNKE